MNDNQRTLFILLDDSPEQTIDIKLKEINKLLKQFNSKDINSNLHQIIKILEKNFKLESNNNLYLLSWKLFAQIGKTEKELAIRSFLKHCDTLYCKVITMLESYCNPSVRPEEKRIDTLLKLTNVVMDVFTQSVVHLEQDSICSFISVTMKLVLWVRSGLKNLKETMNSGSTMLQEIDKISKKVDQIFDELCNLLSNSESGPLSEYLKSNVTTQKLIVSELFSVYIKGIENTYPILLKSNSVFRSIISKNYERLSGELEFGEILKENAQAVECNFLEIYPNLKMNPPTMISNSEDKRALKLFIYYIKVHQFLLETFGIHFRDDTLQTTIQFLMNLFSTVQPTRISMGISWCVNDTQPLIEQLFLKFLESGNINHPNTNQWIERVFNIITTKVTSTNIISSTNNNILLNSQLKMILYFFRHIEQFIEMVSIDYLLKLFKNTLNLLSILSGEITMCTHYFSFIVESCIKLVCAIQNHCHQRNQQSSIYLFYSILIYSEYYYPPTTQNLLVFILCEIYKISNIQQKQWLLEYLIKIVVHQNNRYEPPVEIQNFMELIFTNIYPQLLSQQKQELFLKLVQNELSKTGTIPFSVSFYLRISLEEEQDILQFLIVKLNRNNILESNQDLINILSVISNITFNNKNQYNSDKIQLLIIIIIDILTNLSNDITIYQYLIESNSNNNILKFIYQILTNLSTLLKPQQLSNIITITNKLSQINNSQTFKYSIIQFITSIPTKSLYTMDLNKLTNPIKSIYNHLFKKR
ncbi:hypothetical protein DLAC_03133 [Tieghemostelium lacteum]|uniref:Uncharacterized protein n=1 Tax=Tieghemostelium lacteum TaxID=361077 RepID=A0A152A2Q4_TIELA|nr:hypothetical protein DLAC_03133 [Tieghemostelium lacteum]|eukprot:KYR00385.1 hypothetical protein DLAC_03133 [Tieghemostelium lacteum]